MHDGILIVRQAAVLHRHRALEGIGLLVGQNNVVEEEIMPGVELVVKEGVGAFGHDIREGTAVLDLYNTFDHRVNALVDLPHHQGGGMVRIVLGSGKKLELTVAVEIRDRIAPGLFRFVLLHGAELGVDEADLSVRIGG